MDIIEYLESASGVVWRALHEDGEPAVAVKALRAIAETCTKEAAVLEMGMKPACKCGAPINESGEACYNGHAQWSDPPVGCNHNLGRNTSRRCVKGTDGCTMRHDGLTYTRDKGVHICTDYQRPAGVMGGPCLNCGGSQPEHAFRHRTIVADGDLYCGACKTRIAATDWMGSCPRCGNGTMREIPPETGAQTSPERVSKPDPGSNPRPDVKPIRTSIKPEWER